MTVHAAALPIGTELADGKYRIVGFLGCGAMGAVFEAENTLTAKRVALKCVEVGRHAKESSAVRLLREARIAASIRHPNVVDVYDVIRWDGYLGLVMERLYGEPLSIALKAGRLSSARALSILLPVMRGVAAAHRRGVIHRDIKPANIFLANVEDTVGPVPKLLDFGIAKFVLEELEASALTSSGQFVGTPLYMSLEQFVASGEIDPRADVYSLGVVLYEALTGRLPFEATTVPGLVVKLTSEIPPTPCGLQPDVPGGVSQVVMRAIARDRDDRIASVDALIAALEEASHQPSRSPSEAQEQSVAGPQGTVDSIHARGPISYVASAPRPRLGAAAAWSAVAMLIAAFFTLRTTSRPTDLRERAAPMPTAPTAVAVQPRAPSAEPVTGMVAAAPAPNERGTVPVDAGASDLPVRPMGSRARHPRMTQSPAASYAEQAHAEIPPAETPDASPPKTSPAGTSDILRIPVPKLEEFTLDPLTQPR